MKKTNVIKFTFRLLAVCLLTCVPVWKMSAQQNAKLAVSDNAGDFAVVSSEGNVAQIVVDANDHSVVRIAAEMFAADVDTITGKMPQVSSTMTEGVPSIIVGTVGTSALIGELGGNNLISTDAVAGKWETFGIQTVEYKGQTCLVVYGSDPRGTAYGLMELSRAMGVHPWNWWADITPETKDAIYISATDAVFGPPSVKYRGIFINDEDWGLQPWAAKHKDKDIKDIGPNTYKLVFELMLRMKANYLWPAMHPCTKAFWYYKGNPELARQYAIVMGSSHCEPLLRNNVDEWTNNFVEEYGTASGDWNWKTNKDNVMRYWTDRVIESKDNDAIYTVGMRGVHDSSMPGYSNNTEKNAALKDVIKTQRNILAENLGKDASEVPQMFNPYKEALTLYRMGLDLADDITLVWPDDNFGYIRQLSTPEEQARSGGGGVYYHFSYWGVPNDHLWLSSVSPALTSNEMCKAYDMNCKNIWIYNVGDIKPHELEAQFGMDLAWNVESWRPEKAHEYPYYWALEIFGDETLAENIAKIKKEYYRLAAAGKPEQIHAISYSDEEIEQRLEDYNNLSEYVQTVSASVPARLKHAYYQLITYPCKAACFMNVKILRARQSHKVAAQGNKELTLQYAQEAQAAYQKIINITNYYNKSLSAGKWDKMMDYAPRGLSHFKAPNVATVDNVNSYETVPAPVVEIVKMSAGRYSAASASVKTLCGVGVADTSVTVLPLNMTSYSSEDITSAPYAEYKIDLRKGLNEVKVKCLPTFPLYDGLDLRYALSVDGSTPEFKSVKMAAEASPWSTNVQTGFSYGTHSVTAEKDGEVTLRVYMADPGLVLSEIEVTLADDSEYTQMLVNPDFEYKAEGVLNNGAVSRGDPYGWTRTGTIKGNSFGLSADATGYSGTSICWYNSTPMPAKFELSQTVKGLPDGEYIVRCKLGVFLNEYTNQRLFANNVVQYYGDASAYDKNIVDGETYTFAGNAFGKAGGSKGQLNEMGVKVMLLDGEDLTVGIRSSNMLADGKTATNHAGWFKVDDFRLELVREITIESLLSDLDSLIRVANDLYSTTEEGNLTGQYSAESRSTFAQAISDAQAVIDSQDNKTNAELIQATATLRQAIMDYQASAVEYTSRIVNASFEYKAEGIKNDGSTVRGIPYGWTSEGTLIPDAWGNKSYGINGDASNLVGKNCCWINSGIMPEPYRLYQTVEGLPAGQYRLSCRMANFTDLISTQRLFANKYVTYFGAEEDYGLNLTEGEIAGYAGHTPTDDAELKPMSVEFTLEEGETLTLGVRSGNVLKDGSTATDNAGWFKVDHFTLEYIALPEATAINGVRHEQTGRVDVYSVSGLKLRSAVEKGCALKGLPKGIYIVGGQKVAL